MKTTSRVPKVLLVLYIILFIICAINPFARDVWFVENLTVLAVVIPLVILYFFKVRFSATSYILMSVFIFMHTIGGHYTFELVPFGFVDKLIGSSRDNYDRFAHFSVGFYAFALADILEAKMLITRRWVAVLFGIFAIGALAASYEIFEWIYAISSDPTAGIAVLGSQGDIWDAQKDMLADISGAIVAGIAYVLVRKNRLSK